MNEHQTTSQYPYGKWQMSRRALLTFVAPTIGASLLAACAPAAQAPAPTAAAAGTTAPAAGASASPATTSASPVAAASPTAAGPQPKSGGTLRVGMSADIARLDGQLFTAVETTWMPYDRLSAYDEKFQPQPMLAESWEVASDFRQIKLNLRKGVTFHTGREFTSDDVKWNVQYVRSPKVAAGALVQQSNWYQEIETPDKYTVILKSDRPRPMTFDFFEFFNIVDREAMEGPAPETKSIGTGPYIFKEWVQGTRLTFTKNPNYWRPGRPYLDEVVVMVLGDPQTMVTQLEAGAIDAAFGPPLRDFDRLRKDSKFTALTVNSSMNVMGANTTLPPTDNKLLRQALNHAIDRKRIRDSVYLSIGDATPQLWSSTSPAFEAGKMDRYGFDLDRAKALISQSGLTGIAFDLVITSTNAEFAQVAQILKSDFDKLGITLTIRPYDTAGYLDQINNHKYKGVYLGSVAYASASPVTVIANSRHLDPLGNSNTGYTSPKYVELYNSAATEPDAEKRKQLYSQLNDLFLDESAVMPLLSAPSRMVTRTSVHGIVGSAHGAFKYNDAWKD